MDDPILTSGGDQNKPTGDDITRTGISNPFGFGAGQVVQIKPVVWHFSSRGVLPLHSVMMRDTVAHGVSSDPDNNRFDLFDGFGPGGTLTARLGRSPTYQAS